MSTPVNKSKMPPTHPAARPELSDPLRPLEAMRMESRRCAVPWLLPVIIKLGHFRQLSSPFEVIEFESDRGKEMCGAVGVIRCSRCKVSVMHQRVAGVCCVVSRVGGGLTVQ